MAVGGRDTVSLSVLLDSLLQKAYHDLTVLAELLPEKSDFDRKVEIVQSARRTRLLLIRLLALVKWAGNSSSVQKCTEMSSLVSQQSWLYVDTANQLVDLARNTLTRACMPNFSLATALDVLVSGTYPRLPTCIRDSIIPLPPLPPDQQEDAFSMIDCAIRRRLLQETVPHAMHVRNMGKGRVTFVVPYEFELTLSVLNDDFSVPWRLVALKILVGESLPDQPVLIHEMQRVFLHQLIQSRLFAEDSPLVDCYHTLHSFCLSLKLDCLHSQAIRLSADIYGGYVKVDEYTPGQHMKLGYWRPSGSSQFLSAFLLNQNRVSSWPKVVITVDLQSSESPFTTTHQPPLPQLKGVGLPRDQLSLEVLLASCISARSRALLREMEQGLANTAWQGRATLVDSPLSLQIRVPLKHSEGRVVLGVDARVGHIVATVEPPSAFTGVRRVLDELEGAVMSSKEALPAQLSALQCQLFLAQISDKVTELGLESLSSLPLASPLPLQTSGLLYVRLPRSLSYLVVGVEPGILDHYHLLQVSQSGTLLSPTNLVELDMAEITADSIRGVLVKQTSSLLKRKLQAGGLEMPSYKRLCLHQDDWFAPLPFLVDSRLSLSHVQSRLTAAQIISHQMVHMEHGAPLIQVFSFPQLMSESEDVHTILSSLLQSCQITATASGHLCVMVFSPLEDGEGEEVVLTEDIPASTDLGEALLASWQLKIILLGMTLELKQYLKDPDCPVSSRCQIVSFTYSQLAVGCGKYKMEVVSGSAGLRVKFSDGCPHTIISSSLEKLLISTRSLPLLLQGLVLTEEAMEVLSAFVSNVPTASIVANYPQQEIQLRYESFSVCLHLLSDSSVEFVGIVYSKPIAGSVQSGALSYLQDFLQGAVLGRVDNKVEDIPQQPPSSAVVPRPMLMPCPSPIMSPWPASPLPSIPSLPSPGDMTRVGGGSGGAGLQSSWAFHTTLDQLRSLFAGSEEGKSPMECFLGSLNLLYHFIRQATQDRLQQPQQVNERSTLQFTSCDRGIYTYRSDSLAVSLSLDLGLHPSLKLSVKPTQENTWGVGELQVFVEFFRQQFAGPPYSCSSMTSFVQLLLLPLSVLKSCVQLMQMQMHPPPSLIWKVSLCTTIPQGMELGDSFPAGSHAIIFKGKLLTFVKFVHSQQPHQFTLPVLHDPKTNQTYVARSPSIARSTIHQNADMVIKKTSGEYQTGHHESSLFPALRSLANTQLPV